MSIPTWTVKAGDKHRRITLALTDIVLTGATGVTFRMRNREGGALVVNAAGTLDTVAGTASYQFTGTQLDTPGAYDLEAAITFADGVETVPTAGFVQVLVAPKLS